MDATPHLRGYCALEKIIGHFPDLAIFRKFLSLNAGNLLCLQAELVHLENELDAIILKDRDTSGGAEKTHFGISVYHLKFPPGLAGHGLQWKKRLEIRDKLAEYNDALVHFSYLTSLPPADKYRVRSLRDWFRNNDGYHRPTGLEIDTWSAEFEADLSSLNEQDKDEDTVSKWIAGPFMQWYHNALGYRWHDPHSLAEAQLLDPLHHYSNSSISATVNFMSTMLSSLLPTLSIFALYFIHSPLARLGVILGFTCTFTAVLTLIAKAKRIECFAAATAFAAVQVVFVGSVSLR